MSASVERRPISACWRAGDLAQPLFVLRARVEVLRVGALVLAQVALVEVQHLRDRLVEQLEVVAHDEQRTAVRAEEAHQPFLGVDVEVVGGLVEHQVVGAAEQDARELDAAALAAGQDGERQQGAVGRESEPGEDAVHVGLGAVAAGVTEGLLGVREPADRPLARVVLHVAAELLQLVALCVEAASRQHVCHRDVLGAGTIGAGILGQEAERAGDRDPAARWRRAHRRECAAEWSFPRRCDRPVRPCRLRTPRTTRRRRARARRFRSSVPVRWITVTDGTGWWYPKRAK